MKKTWGFGGRQQEEEETGEGLGAFFACLTSLASLLVLFLNFGYAERDRLDKQMEGMEDARIVGWNSRGGGR